MALDSYDEKWYRRFEGGQVKVIRKRVAWANDYIYETTYNQGSRKGQPANMPHDTIDRLVEAGYCYWGDNDRLYYTQYIG